MQYGFFDDEHLEYIITKPETPLPWINYLGCEDFFGIVSNTGGGYAFYKDARLRRLTRYRYNNVPADTGGRYVYLRDNDAGVSAGNSYWSPTWQPVRRPLDDYSCHHGLGYTRIESTFHGIHSTICYFIPLGENLEIWDVRIQNKRDRKADLSLFSAVEFCLWDAWDDATNFQRNLSIGEVEVEGNVIYHRTEYRERRNHFAFFSCSQPIDGFETQREDFLGAYRGWDTPRAVEENKTHNSIASGWYPIGSHHIHAELEPGEEKRIIFLLGYHENPVENKFVGDSLLINKTPVISTIQKYSQSKYVDRSFEELGTYWRRLLSIFHATTPNIHVNRMVNVWNAYQVMVTYNISRSASFFESGIGRGIGFRDSSQDLLGFCMLDPLRARQRIVDLAATQLETGGTYHQYQPLSKKGNDDIGGGFNDDPLWLVLAVAEYLKETADWEVLNEMIPFDNKPHSEESLFVHLQKSMQYTLDRLGPHDLPLIGRADWNDCLNLNCFSDTPGQSFQTTTNKDGVTAESVLIAGLYILAAQEMVQMARIRQEEKLAQKYENAAKKMEQAVWASGWDGKWFRRAYDYYGDAVGSEKNEEGKIFIEPQGICVMAGLGIEGGKAEQALDSVAEHLATRDGILLQQPAFHRYSLNLGEISSYPPGYKENASVFCHTNPWIMIAEAKIGRGDKALDYYLRINPSVREEMSEVHKCEPYVYAQMISGRDAPVRGEAKNSWLTGTAAWNYVAITRWILGIRPVYEGLQIDPVIPDTWGNFSVTRKFRGVQFHISVQRKGAGRHCILCVDGIRQKGNVIHMNDIKKPAVDVLVFIE